MHFYRWHEKEKRWKCLATVSSKWYQSFLNLNNLKTVQFSQDFLYLFLAKTKGWNLCRKNWSFHYFPYDMNLSVAHEIFRRIICFFFLVVVVVHLIELRRKHEEKKQDTRVNSFIILQYHEFWTNFQIIRQSLFETSSSRDF